MSKAATRSGTGNRRNTRQVPFYRHSRRIILWGAVASAVVIFVSLRGGGGSQVTGGAFTGGDFHSLVVDPNNPKRIFAGGHEAVSASTDGGKGWRQVPSLKNRDAMGWGFAGSTVYVSGHPGLSVSSDGGQEFRERNANLPSTDVHALGVGEGILYGASPGVGFFASTDGGNSWEVVNTKKGHSFFGRILVDPADSEHVIAADTRAGVAESRDGGRTFRSLGGIESPTWVSWDPTNPKTILASGFEGAARTEDGGTTWSRLATPPAATIVELDPADPQLLYAGVHDGSTVDLFVSDDGGRTWKKP